MFRYLRRDLGAHLFAINRDYCLTFIFKSAVILGKQNRRITRSRLALSATLNEDKDTYLFSSYISLRRIRLRSRFPTSIPRVKEHSEISESISRANTSRLKKKVRNRGVSFCMDIKLRQFALLRSDLCRWLSRSCFNLSLLRSVIKSLVDQQLVKVVSRSSIVTCNPQQRASVPREWL